jgi:cysteine desulfurase
MNVYLDNAATTPLDQAVLDAMLPYYRDHFGNPSSIHAHGRAAKAAIETARKTIADLLNTSPAKIYFTSGGTEGDNTAIRGITETFGIRHVISTAIEHHAVLETLKVLKTSKVLRTLEVSWLDLDANGNIDSGQLEELLNKNPQSLVSLMHANNEIGNLIDLERIGEICRENDAWFHSDTVQTVGKYPLSLDKLNLHAAVGSAHKFHGPKGAGFLYLDTGGKIPPLMTGGGQEKEMRPGTENVAGIVGLAKALEIAYRDMEQIRVHVRKLKEQMISGLKESIPAIQFNGNSGNPEASLDTVLSIHLPVRDEKNMILFKLDLDRISASGGSACASGALKGSHVINRIRPEGEGVTLRFSFSKYNTAEEIDQAVKSLRKIYDQVSLTRA